MSKNAYPMPTTIQSAGIEQHMRRQQDCEAEHRGEHLGSENAPFSTMGPSSDWHREWHLREEYHRQEGMVQGKSTYEQGSVFAPGPRKQEDPPIEDMPHKSA
jgi:hypothetical protein